MQAKPLKITQSEPTSIVADFTIFLTYLKQQPVILTKAKQQLARKDLRALYELLPNLGLEVGERSTQSYYPVINLFVELALKLQLINQTYSGSTSSFVVAEDQLQAFEKLTATEQYATLLKCFWLEANWETLQGALYATHLLSVSALLEYLNGLPVDEKILLQKDQHMEYLLAQYGHFLLYFHYFGFWEVELNKELEPKTKIKATAIVIKPILKPLIPTLRSSYKNQMSLHSIAFLSVFAPQLTKGEQTITDEAQFIAALKPLFAKGQLKKVLQKKESVMLKGEYLLKVAHSRSCWRTIALQDSHTLLELHQWIQEAFDFGDDHLYAFYMDNQPFSSNCFNSPHDAEGPFVDEITIGELYLHEGQQFLYLFDFGDEWTFSVTVDKITEGINDVEPGIREKKGKSPEQYDWY